MSSVIVDEAQYIKNKSTKSARAVSQLNSIYRLCMTGTPMMNNVTELYSLIRFLRIPPYNSYERFMMVSNKLRDLKIIIDLSRPLDNL